MSDTPWSVLAAAVTRLGDRIDAQPVVREATVSDAAALLVRFDTDQQDTKAFASLASLRNGDRVLTIKLRHYVWVLGVRGGEPTEPNRVLRLTKTSAQSTSGTVGQPTSVVWNSGSGSPGMWNPASSASRVYPNLPGWWRIHAKIRFSSSSVSGYVQIRVNGQNNPESEGLDLNSQAGPYAIAEDFVFISNPGADYVEAVVFSLGTNQGLIPTNCLLLAEYLGQA